jgi:hypothetical protein
MFDVLSLVFVLATAEFFARGNNVHKAGEAQDLGSARVSRVGFGVSPQQSFRKVRERETRALPRDCFTPPLGKAAN